MNLDMINPLFHDFGKTLGIDTLTLDENGCCCLLFDDIVVNFEATPESEQLFLYTRLGSIPDKDKEAFFAALLEGNYFYRTTGGATLGVDQKSNSVVMAYQTFYTHLDVRRFSQIVENFVNIASFWLKKLQQPGAYASAGVAVALEAPSWLRA